MVESMTVTIKKHPEIGDLVQRRRGDMEPFEAGLVGLYVGKHRDPLTNPAFYEYSIKVLYPGRPIRFYRPDDFDVVSSST